MWSKKPAHTVILESRTDIADKAQIKINRMKALLQLEELAMFLGSIYLLYIHEVPWWVYPLLVLGPDIGMLGYLVSNKVGAITYNILHHKGIAVLVYASGVILQNEAVQIAGLVLFGHSSMDRVFGYGLKYVEGFKHTHLGKIGHEQMVKKA